MDFEPEPDEEGPEFIYGPKDGGKVPPILWVLDVIELQEHRPSGTLIHRYLINEKTKNYEYAGYYEGNK